MSENASERTNVVFILSDDQGPWAMRCAGNDDIITPNLDRLARTGTRFKHFFCASPVCSAARASLMTGRIPSQHGVHDWISKGNMGDGDQEPIEYLRGITGYPELLAQAGWHCGISGKWHLGDSMKPQKGFRFWYVHESGSGRYYGAPMIRDGERVEEQGYITDVITDEAIGFMADTVKKQKPFYLAVNYTAPHSPWINQHPEEYEALYRNKEFGSFPLDEPVHPWVKRPRIDPKEMAENLKWYYASITAMDANIGRILDWLELHRLRENTMVIFLSDNGFNFGHHGFVGKGNATFPMNMYEESITVPAIFSQPGVIPEGRVSDALVSGYDVMPTLLDCLGVANPEEDHLPGISFKQVLSGDAAETRKNVVVFDEYGPVRMIRTERWKYVHRYPYGPHELYDLVRDAGERNNLIDEPAHRDIRLDLLKKMEEWFAVYVDPAIDGTREPVKGKGQLYWAGIKGREREQYSQKL